MSIGIKLRQEESVVVLLLEWWARALTPTVAFLFPCLFFLFFFFICPCCRCCCFCHRVNNNNILDSSQRDIKAVVRSHNEEHISIILSHETHSHIHTLRYAPPFSQYVYTNRNSVAYQHDCANVSTSIVSRFLSLTFTRLSLTFTHPVWLSESRESLGHANLIISCSWSGNILLSVFSRQSILRCRSARAPPIKESVGTSLK